MGFVFDVLLSGNFGDISRFCIDNSVEKWISEISNQIPDIRENVIIDKFKFNVELCIDSSYWVFIRFKLENDNELFEDKNYTEQELKQLYDRIYEAIPAIANPIIEKFNKELSIKEISYFPQTDCMYYENTNFLIMQSYKYANIPVEYKCLQYNTIDDHWNDNDSLSNMFWEINEQYKLIDGELILER